MPDRPIAKRVAERMKSASWIREMFEKGLRLKAERGVDNVQDLSLGNPNGIPPEAFFDAINVVAADRRPDLHRYMPNAGLFETRAAVAGFLTAEYGIEFDADSLCMTSGAAAGLNVALHAICDPGDEIILLAPYFPEYTFYIEQAQATAVIVPTDDAFQPDLAALKAAITPRTRGIIINSPNNPTGVVYSDEKCAALSKLLERHDSAERPIYLVLDDPYRRIVYDADRPASVADHYHRLILTSSYSKDLSIAGERAGYIAVPPSTPAARELRGAMTMLNRTLGIVNMSAFMQRVVARCADSLCDIDFYRRNRDRLCDALDAYGYELIRPGGALYAFPKTPIADDVAFIDVLMKHGVLAVPGRGFGRAGYMRLSFAVEPKVIERALPGFKAAIEEVRGAGVP